MVARKAVPVFPAVPVMKALHVVLKNSQYRKALFIQFILIATTRCGCTCGKKGGDLT